MSKGNLFLGQARGSVGDVTFTHISGVQVARARNRSPKNPQSVLQMVTRIVQASASKAYSLFLPICDHSFQGKPTGTPNQSRFMQLNTAMLRDKLADVIADPTDENARASMAYNFNLKGEQLPCFNSWIVSSGTLPTVPVVYDPTHADFNFINFSGVDNPLNITYQDIVTALHAQQGDQLTLIALAHNMEQIGDYSPTIDAFEYARIILNPSSGNMSAPFLAQPSGPLVVNLPSERNEGSVSFAWHNGALAIRSLGTLEGESALGNSRWICGLAAILSRRVGETWERSHQQVVFVDSGQHALNWGLFGDAYESYLRADRASALYLNQGGVRQVDASVGGALEWISPASGVSIPASGGIVPAFQFGSAVYVFQTSDTAPSSTSTVALWSGNVSTLEAQGYRVVVLAEYINTSYDEQALSVLNSWFTPHANLVGDVRP